MHVTNRHPERPTANAGPMTDVSTPPVQYYFYGDIFGITDIYDNPIIGLAVTPMGDIDYSGFGVTSGHGITEYEVISSLDGVIGKIQHGSIENGLIGNTGFIALYNTFLQNFRPEDISGITQSDLHVFSQGTHELSVRAKDAGTLFDSGIFGATYGREGLWSEPHSVGSLTIDAPPSPPPSPPKDNVPIVWEYSANDWETELLLDGELYYPEESQEEYFGNEREVFIEATNIWDSYLAYGPNASRDSSTSVELPPGLTNYIDFLPGETGRVWQRRKLSDLYRYRNQKVKFVFHYVQQSEGYTWRGDIQLDDIKITPNKSRGDGIKNYSFESEVPEGWETSDGGGVGSDVEDKYGNISSYDDVDWVPIQTGNHRGRWNRDTGGTPTTGTGDLETGNTGDYYLYAETSAAGTGSTNNAYGRGFFLRTESFILGDNPQLEYAYAQDGSRMGDLKVYIDIQEDYEASAGHVFETQFTMIDGGENSGWSMRAWCAGRDTLTQLCDMCEIDYNSRSKIWNRSYSYRLMVMQHELGHCLGVTSQTWGYSNHPGIISGWNYPNTKTWHAIHTTQGKDDGFPHIPTTSIGGYNSGTTNHGHWLAYPREYFGKMYYGIQNDIMSTGVSTSVNRQITRQTTEFLGELGWVNKLNPYHLPTLLIPSYESVPDGACGYPEDGNFKRTVCPEGFTSGGFWLYTRYAKDANGNFDPELGYDSNSKAYIHRCDPTGGGLTTQEEGEHQEVEDFDFICGCDTIDEFKNEIFED